VGFVAAAFALTLILQRLALRAYFILYVPAVMFSTWFGVRGAGLFASALTSSRPSTFCLALKWRIRQRR